MHRRTIRSLALVTILLIPAILPGAAPRRGPARAPDRAFHHEVPDDAYVPVPREGRPTSPTADHSVSPRLLMRQVNVNGQGQNILLDAGNEPSIAVDPTDPDRMAIGWRQFDTILSNFRQAGWSYTTDGGETWTFPGVIEPGIFRSDPVLDFDAQGNFYYNSLTVGGADFWCDVFISSDGGASWDGGTFAQGGDKQWMRIDRSGSIGDGHIYAFWTDAYSVCGPDFFTRSVDGGASYEDCTSIPGSPFWGTLAVGTDGELYVGGVGFPDFLVAKSTDARTSGPTVTWDFTTDVSLDGSVGFGNGDGPNPDGLLGQTWIDVDHSNGPARGNVYLLCSVERFSPPFDILDVMFARSTDGGVTWSEPVRVNDDDAPDAYQWFGTMSVAPTGRIDVVWLDTRDNPGGYDSSLYYAYSTDAGATWSENERLSESFDPHVGWPQQNKMGDYFDMVSDSTGARLSWAGTFNGEQDVYYGRIHADLFVPGEFATIQAAIDAAEDGNVIVVAPGTYMESGIDFHGKAVTLRSTRPDDPGVVAATVVHGDSSGSVFLFQGGEDSLSVLEGLTIRGGGAGQGGGVFVENASPTIRKNVITGNRAAGTLPEGTGGGIFVGGGAPRITGNTITANEAPVGGGIAAVDGADLRIENNVIIGNATDFGGGISIGAATASIINNTLSGNIAGQGGGIHVTLCSEVTVVNTIFWGDSAAAGPEISVAGDTCASSLAIRYSTLQGGANGAFVAPGNTLDAGEGMISTDPLFRDAAAGDYHLSAVSCGDTSDSPAIDAGDPSVFDLALDCGNGLGSDRSDIGAFGGRSKPPVSIGDDGPGPVGNALPRASTLGQNYPNPFNPSTTIAFVIPAGVPGDANGNRRATLTVYDLRGRHVRTLVDAEMAPGRHEIAWDGRDERGARVSSGIFLYTLHAGGESATRKMAILK